MSSKLKTPIYDLFSPENLLNPYSLFKKLRSEHPVYFSELNGFWILTRYADVYEALHDERLSSNRNQLYINRFHNIDINAVNNFINLASNFLVEADPPEHTTQRKIVLPGFTNAAVKTWRSTIQETIKDLLDKFQGKHSIDIVTDLSGILPGLVMTKIFGIPEKHRDNFIKWALDIGAFWGTPDSQNIQAIASQANHSAAYFSALIKQIIAERKEEPGTDIISLLIAAYEENGIDLNKLPSSCVEILIAGYVTTTDLIANGVHALLEHPEELQKLKDNPELINSAIEEMIRFDTPGPIILRIAKEELCIGGKNISQGSVIALALGAANHDPEKFDSPEVFDITRSPNEHLGFGKGIHSCLGAILARMELNICFTTLLRRMPNMMLSPEKPPIPKRENLIFKGFHSLPVKF
ncbi:MAG: cytochrome P450 [Calothrix sp. MO_167.B12]|nr:cytochrome P450 [Calothrix sp. MO_167.B12]